MLTSVAALPIRANAADASRPVFACALPHGLVSVTALGDQLTLRLRLPGKAVTTVIGSAAHRTAFTFQDRYAGMEHQLRVLSGRRSYIVFSMTGNVQTGAQPVSGLAILLDRTLKSDQPCVSYTEFTPALSDLSLPKDSAEYSAMRLK